MSKASGAGEKSSSRRSVLPSFRKFFEIQKSGIGLLYAAVRAAGVP